MRQLSRVLNTLFAIFFWIFNITLLLLVCVGILVSGSLFWSDAVAGQLPFDFVIAFIGLVGAPTTCSLAGIKSQRHLTQARSRSYFQLFYLVEAPIVLLCLMRFFWLRDLTPVSAFILLAGSGGAIAAVYRVLRRKETPSNEWELAGQTLTLTLAIYLSAIATFYVLPIVELVLPRFPLFAVSSLMLLPFTVVLLGIGSLPFGMTIAYGQAWVQSWKQLTIRRGVRRIGAVVAAVLAVEFGLVMLLQQQPQLEAFRLLQTPPTSDRESQDLLQQSDVIRRGLLNAYLSPYRYPVSDTGMRDLYHFLPNDSAQKVQDLYNVLLTPFRYNGTKQDVNKAAALFAQFFDTPILRAEKTTIQTALQSTFDRTQAKAGLDDINERRVWLQEQQVTVKPAGDWAEVELYEVYDNKTLLPEEILYSFSLPESAVMTGVWLGETSDRNRRHEFDVSPRGAAQQVYTEQVKRQVDPALLEQVGLRTYRLRAFPIPPQGRSAKMHLWMTYKVMRQESGWALPQLHERRNLFWTVQTKRRVNNQVVTAQDQWLPIALPAEKVEPKLHQVTLTSGSRVIAAPYPVSAYQLPSGQRFAVVLDRSYSMTAHRAEVTQTLNWLKEAVLKQNTADLYLTAAAAPPQRTDIQTFDPQTTVFYGSFQPREMLNQFLQLRGNTRYDAVLLVTDSGSYELSKDQRSTISLSAPLWMVHLGGLQFAYDDATLQAIQNSGGGVSTTIQEVMQRLGTRPTLGEGTSLLNLVDGYAWFLGKPSEQSSSSEEAFAPLAARQWITQLNESVKPDQLNQLDTIHAIAQQYKIVTPLSSMIVLVNEQQRQDLKQAKQQRDRFNREVEDQQLPQSTTVSAVPEPAEWMLIAVGLLLLGLIYRQKERSYWE